MSAKSDGGLSKWVDPDDAPELDDAFFEAAEIRQGEVLVRRGRPRSTNPKLLVTLRIDRDVVEAFKADGAGWQSRMNEALRIASSKR
jgi:uncharacterized protein (DUF4415 family)